YRSTPDKNRTKISEIVSSMSATLSGSAHTVNEAETLEELSILLNIQDQAETKDQYGLIEYQCRFYILRYQLMSTIRNSIEAVTNSIAPDKDHESGLTLRLYYIYYFNSLLASVGNEIFSLHKM